MAHLFQHLFRETNSVDGRWQGIEVKRGQIVTSRESLSLETGISVRSVRTCLERLKSTGELTIKTTNKYSIITLCNYDSYQKNFHKNDQQNDQQPDQQSTRNRPAIDHKQEDKELQKIKKNSNSVRFDSENRIITGLNQEDFDQWKLAFPAVPIETEIQSATQWLIDNPTKRKKQVRRFLTNWLRRRQERGGSIPSKPGINRLPVLIGKVCSKDGCGMPAVYKSSGGAYDYFYCSDHMPEKVKEKYA